MKWEMNENSLFAILLRSPWWVSTAIGLTLGAIAYAALPAAYKTVGALAGLPFLGIGVMAGWQQFQAPSAKRIERTVTAVRALAWTEFAPAVEAGYRRDGYEVERLDLPGADFAIRKEWRTTLVSGKRWKVARTGIEPLRDLHSAKEARAAHDCVYFAIGDVTENARKFAADHRITLAGGAELARLLPGIGRGGKPA